jgi:hypothetical protein
MLLSLLAFVVCGLVAYWVARDLCHCLPTLSARDLRLVEKRRRLMRDPYDARAMHLCLDFDNAHPWVRRWERRYGNGGEDE